MREAITKRHDIIMTFRYTMHFVKESLQYVTNMLNPTRPRNRNPKNGGSTSNDLALIRAAQCVMALPLPGLALPRPLPPPRNISLIPKSRLTTSPTWSSLVST